jgi:CheY-specific phosphatase CheX
MVVLRGKIGYSGSVDNKIMADMTDEEYDALDELWTKTVPPIKKGAGGGFFTEHRARMVVLDELTARILNAKAMATRKTPSELITAMVHKELSASA